MKSLRLIFRIVVYTVLIFLNTSFKFGDFVSQNKYNNQINRSLKKVFNLNQNKLELHAINNNSFYAIKNKLDTIGYFVVDQALSKFQPFDYVIFFDKSAQVLSVEILQYRENYGAEICSKRWLKKFFKIQTNNFMDYNLRVNAISGATISVNSIKKAVFKKSNLLKKHILVKNAIKSDLIQN